MNVGVLVQKINRTILARLGAFSASFLFSTVVALVSIPFIIGVLGADVWSELAVSQAVAALAAIVVAYGWGTVGAATIAAAPADIRRQLFLESLVSRVYLFLLSAPLMFFLMLLLNTDHAFMSAFASVVYLLPALGASWYFVGEAKPWKLFLLAVLPQGMGTIFGVIAVQLYPEPLLLVASQFVFGLGGVVVSSSRILKRIPGSQLKLELGLVSVCRGLAAQKHGVIAAATGTLNSSLPLVVVSAIIPSSVAIYAMSDKLFRFSVAALAPAVQVVQGWIPEGGQGQIVTRIRLMARFSPFLGVLGGAGMAIFLPWVSQVFSRGEINVGYDLSVPFGVIFGSVAVAQFIGLACLIPLGQGAVLAASTAVGAVINVPLMFIFATGMGSSGLAWSVAAVEVFITAWQLIVALRLSHPMRNEALAHDRSQVVNR